MIISDHSPVIFTDPLPEKVDVVIIGAGVIGVATAWFLLKQGLSVFICEKGRVAGEQSSRNWGWIRQQGRDRAELPIMMDSIDIWESLQHEIGEDLGFYRGGVLYLAEDESRAGEFDEWLQIAHDHGLDSRLLGTRDIDNLIKDGPGQWHAALYTPSDGRAEPFVAVPALARAVQQRGCGIRENCAARVVETAAGKPAAVITEQGPIKCQAVLCAAGAWSSRFLHNLGVRLPQLTVKCTVARTAPAIGGFAGNAVSSDLAFRRRQDGGYTLSLGDYLEHFPGADSIRHLPVFLPLLKSYWREIRLRTGTGLPGRFSAVRTWDASTVTPFEQNRVWNPPASDRAVQLIRERLARRLPSLAGIEIPETWAGMIETTPDVVPVMDQVGSCPGLYVATGFSGHGFGIGPGAGRVMADMISGKQPRHDLHRFRLSRFSDGSRLELGPAL